MKRKTNQQVAALTNRTTFRVRFSEIDSMQIVWHGEYVRYFEDGREAFGKQYGLDYMSIYREGYMVPIVDLTCQSGIRMILFDTKETVHHHDGRTLWNQIEYSFSLYDNFPVVHFNLHCTMLCPIPKWSSIFSTSNPAALMHRSISSE